MNAQYFQCHIPTLGKPVELRSPVLTILQLLLIFKPATQTVSLLPDNQVSIPKYDNRRSGCATTL